MIPELDPDLIDPLPRHVLYYSFATLWTEEERKACRRELRAKWDEETNTMVYSDDE